MDLRAVTFFVLAAIALAKPEGRNPRQRRFENSPRRNGQRHQDFGLDDIGGQQHQNFDWFNHDEGQNYEDIGFGHKPGELSGQTYENFDFGQEPEKLGHYGQKYEEIEFGQRPEKLKPESQKYGQSASHDGLSYEDIEIGQKPENEDNGQKYEDIEFGQKPEKQNDTGQKYEEIDFGQKPEEQSPGQKQDEIDFGQKHEKPTDDGQKHEEIGFGQKLEDQDHGQKYEDIEFGQKPPHKTNDDGQKYEEVEFQQKPEKQKDAGQTYEDIDLGQTHDKTGTKGQASEDVNSNLPTFVDGQHYDSIQFGDKPDETLGGGQNHMVSSGNDRLEMSNPGTGKPGHFPDENLKFPDDLNETEAMDEGQQLHDTEIIHFDKFPRPKPYDLGGGCSSRPHIPANSILKCPTLSKCRATCIKGYRLPNGKGEVTVKCVDQEWKFLGHAQESLPSCKPLCLPPCQNNGICVAPDQCDCPKNFGGPQCQFEKKPCLNYPSLPANSMRSCTSRSCTITCADGYSFPDGSGITNMLCRDGQWVPSRTDWTTLPDCQPICHPPCSNGGNCLAFNVCQCPQQYTGPQCQYAMSACTGKKLNFNGQYNCTGDGEKLTCNIHCPSGIPLDSSAANFYTCRYSTGKFTPQPIPQCVYGANVVVISNSSSSTFHLPGQVLSNSWEQGHGHVKVPEEIGDLFKTDLKPGPGECSTWQGSHYKTFDGRIFSFECPCSYTLVQDSVGNTFRVVLENQKCAEPPCHRNIQIFYQDRQFILIRQENGTVLKVDGVVKLVPIQLFGFSIELKSRFLLITLQAIDVYVKWDEKDFVSVSVKENMWNRTAGLCGNLNYVPADDFYTDKGFPAQNLQTFIDSWRSESIDDESECNATPQVENTCESNFTSDHCELILTDHHFAECRKIINAKSFYETCIWDACKCGRNCSCPSISAFVEECKIHINDPSPNWRAITNCPLSCDGGKIYSSCGPQFQHTCGSFEKFSETTACHEGCFCPNGTVLHKGTCIAKELCPCEWKKRSFASGESIPKGCNTCTCQSGHWICTEVNCGARCSAVGDPHYVTFDGKRYDFMGQCSYILMQSDNYTVEAENIPCSGTISKSMNLLDTSEAPSCTKTIIIRYRDVTIKLKQNHEVYINGEQIPALPHKVDDLAIRSISSIYMIVSFPDHAEVWWDGITSVYIDVPGELQGKTKGLCGTFNDNQQDDFLTPEGDVEHSPVAFANKWKTEEKCNEVLDTAKSHPCDSHVQHKLVAEKYCNKLKSKIFESCHWIVDVEPFFKNCLYDVCSCTSKASSCFCPIFSDYGNECAREGAPIKWRSDIRECGIHCPGGQVYQACGDSCSRSCRDISFGVDTCRKKCVEGCNCPEGFTLNYFGECIPISSCPCFHYNIEYKPGEQIVMDNYKGPQFCTCSAARWSCRPASEEEIKLDSEINRIKAKCQHSKNEEFSFCEPAEPITCKNMHDPRQHSTKTCYPGCVCKKGYVWDSVGKVCVKSTECPCHHGGISYLDGRTIQNDCNTCVCENGAWNCTQHICPATCGAWGDSHFKTFDGRIYDFQGSCDFVLASGTLSEHETFDIILQIVPCGSSGISCPKSVSLKVGSQRKYEQVIFTKTNPLPSANGLERITVREAGLFVFAEVFDLGILLQWDKGTRVYVKVDPKWKNKLKGLCGNFNNNEMDDFKTPSSGEISEVSAILFADSWRLQSNCPESVQMTDTCHHRPGRRLWALNKCGILKSHAFQSCHSEISVEPYLERCVIDTCGCDEGGDCECLCAAVAAYAHECSMRGIPIRWRSQHMCPIQCDSPRMHYSSCVSPCPVKTCENQYRHPGMIHFCSQEACIEGCELTPCAHDEVYTDQSFTDCTALSSCQTVCLQVGNRTYFEGDLMESDDCHSCFCSHHKKLCSGQPCAPITVTDLPISPPVTEQNEAQLVCSSGWSSWVNRDHPIKGKKLDDVEELPYMSELQQIGSSAICNADQIVDIRCRDTVHHRNYKETGHDVECSIERGLRCISSNESCPDFEISVLCRCEICPEGHAWDSCIVGCDKICHYYRPILTSQDYCSHHEPCVAGCKLTSFNCPRGMFLRDGSTCVPNKDCPCVSHSGALVKPGEVIEISECEKCQCLHNEFECASFCAQPPPTLRPVTSPTIVDKDNRTHTLPGKSVVDSGIVSVIYITSSTISPLTQCSQNRYISLMDDEDTKLSASSSINEASSAEHGRISTALSSWTSKFENSDQYLQVDLGKVGVVYAVTVIGDPSGNYVTAYHLLHSIDGHRFSYVVNRGIANEVFGGPTDGLRPMKQTLPFPVEARYIRFHPISWHKAISMRVDVLGCSDHEAVTPNPILCEESLGIGELPVSHLSVSSAKAGSNEQHLPLNTEGAWQPLTNSQSEWVLIDFTASRNITGVITKGMAQGNDIDAYTPESRVERYKVLYSRDKMSWNAILDDFGNEKIFVGNVDSDTARTNYFKRPVRARYLKLIPTKWYNNIALSLDVLGCYEPYALTTTTSTEPSRKFVENCNICKGVQDHLDNDLCTCGDLWWNGESCVPHTECPCYVDHTSYSVGTTFKTRDCHQCVCRIYGITSCSPIDCGECPEGIQRIQTPTCGCTCKPCPSGTKLCVTSNICLEESAWCNGVQDCPDDETNCTLPQTESPPVCKPSCPPGYQIVYKTLNGPAEVEELKGVKHSRRNKKSDVFHCQPYDCVPVSTESAIECPVPSCPSTYSVSYNNSDHETERGCPSYTCQPPLEFGICDVTSFFVSTFDGLELKHDICDHILARDKSEDSQWEVTMYKMCKRHNQCWFNLAVIYGEHELRFYPELKKYEMDGFNYSYDQISSVLTTTEFNLHRLGDSIVFESKAFGFQVVYTQPGNVKIKVPSALKGHVNGLCGLYSGYPGDDKTRPDGELSKTTAEFGNSWLNPNSITCDIQVCEYEVQTAAFDLCSTAMNKPFDACQDKVDIKRFISRCVESTCSCLASNRSVDDCRCSALLDLAIQCQSKEVFGWRLLHECPSTCPPHLTSYDCYPYACEPECNSGKCATTPATTCYSGCFCPDGLVRKGDRCIRRSDCRDCACHGFGSSQFMTYDQTNFTFGGNCTYVATRDTPESGVPNFQILITNSPCQKDQFLVCTEKVDVHVKGHTINLVSLQSFVKVAAIVDGEILNSDELPFVKPWVNIEEVPGTNSISLELPSYHLELRYFYSRYAFTVNVPSSYYHNKLEGLCGNCNRDPADDITNDDVQLAQKWGINNGGKSCEVVENKKCITEPGDADVCNSMLDAGLFGKCHALVDAHLYVQLCRLQLCHNGSFCSSFEAYAQACRDVGVCVLWRSHHFCPFSCPAGTAYSACEAGCTKTCDNYKNLDVTCDKPLVEGCFCAEDEILVNGSCSPLALCELCDSEGHREGDVWQPTNCSNCTCSGLTVTCSKRECPPNILHCEKDHVAVREFAEHQCCPTFVCACKPKDDCEKLSAADEVLPSGMQTLVNNSGCCPFLEVVCRPETCPPPEPCRPYFVQKEINTTSCCPQYVCEKPTDICFYELLHLENTVSEGEPVLIAKKIGDNWKDGPCKSCACHGKEGSIAETVCTLPKCDNEESHPDHGDYVLKSYSKSHQCCPDFHRAACKQDNVIYEVGETWLPDKTNPCRTMKCVESHENGIVKETFMEICNTTCEIGQEYVKREDACCGNCIYTGCYQNEAMYKAGDTWLSEDRCITFTCSFVLGGFLTTSSYETCPSISDCPAVNIYKDGCCQKCNTTVSTSLSSCAPTEMSHERTLHLVKEIQSYHGQCMNLEPIPHFTECKGTCNSGTYFNSDAWSHDNVCQCCQGLEYSSIVVPLTCEDGYTLDKYVTVPSKCSCQSCGN